MAPPNQVFPSSTSPTTPFPFPSPSTLNTSTTLSTLARSSTPNPRVQSTFARIRRFSFQSLKRLNPLPHSPWRLSLASAPVEHLELEQRATSPLMPPSPRQAPAPGSPLVAALVDALSRSSTPAESIGILDEFAWRSLLSGVRVRDYCAAASSATYSASTPGIRLSLVASPTRLLLPFSVPGGAPPITSVPSSSLSPNGPTNTSRKHLVDALVRLSRERNESAVVEARVAELVLEYVGRRWRAGGETVVDAIARKLADVELEVQVQGEPLGVRAAIFPALQRLRFQLGLVTASQLLEQLNVSPAVTIRSAAFDTKQLLTAWAIRRLSAGTEPQALAEKLLAIRDKLTHHGQHCTESVLASIGLSGRAPLVVESPITPTRPRTRTLSRISFRSKRKTLPVPAWLPHRQAMSPSPNRLRLDEEERRPSLPNTFAPAEAEDPSTPTSETSLCSGSLSSPSGGASPSPSGLVASVSSCSESGEARLLVTDHLLALRYRLGPDADGWFLGCGRDKALQLLAILESKGPVIVDIVVELRKTFGLVQTTHLSKVATVPLREHVSPTALRERDVSFDLDQYIADLGPLGDELSPLKSASGFAESPIKLNFVQMTSASDPPSHSASHTTHASVSSVSSASLRRSSIISEFIICEASVAKPTAQPLEYHFPLTPTILSGFDNDKTTTQHRRPRQAKSMSNLDERYTRFPTRATRLARDENIPPVPPLILQPTISATTPPTPRKDGRLPPIEFPSHFTPPLSPAATDRGYKFPETPLSPALSDSGTLSPRRPSLEDGGRSRRHRQCVIVDGAQVSPRQTVFMAKDSESVTSLGLVLSLFTANKSAPASALQPQEVERALSAAVELEEERALARGEVFDAEGRARMAWLLEQVGRELAQPELVAAVDRVLHTLLASPIRRTSAPESSLFTPSRGGSKRGHALTITVPPPSKCKSVVASPTTSSHTFGPSFGSPLRSAGAFGRPPSTRSIQSTSDTGSSRGETTPVNGLWDSQPATPTQQRLSRRDAVVSRRRPPNEPPLAGRTPVASPRLGPHTSFSPSPAVHAL